jgi:hypothetical protein
MGCEKIARKALSSDKRMLAGIFKSARAEKKTVKGS